MFLDARWVGDPPSTLLATDSWKDGIGMSSYGSGKFNPVSNY